MEWVGCIHCKKIQNNFMAQTCALIAPVQPILHWVPCSNETLPNAPKHYVTTKTWVYCQMRWIGCFDCEKFRGDFMARTYALIAPIQPVLDRVSCSNEHYQMHPNTARRTKTWVLGPMGWIRCVRCEKFRCDFVAKTFALIAPIQHVLHQASCSNETIQNVPKHCESQTWV